MGEERLIDLREGYPESGIYRTVQVYRCRVCKSLTNNVDVYHTTGRYAMRRAYPICPHREADWHRLLRAKRDLASPAHPASYRKEMEAEMTELLCNAADDIAGAADLETERLFPTFKLVLEDGPYFGSL